jgi:hypothetical protein
MENLHRDHRNIRRVLAGAVALAVATLGVVPAGARPTTTTHYRTDKGFGVGVMVGAPTGLSAKYHLTAPLAIAGGIGFSDEWRGHDDGVHLHMDVLWHPVTLLTNPTMALPLYIGVGGRILDHDRRYWDNDGRFYYYGDDDTHVGIRAPFGLVMDFQRIPLDVFFELALVMDVIVSDDDICYDGGGRAFDCGDGHGGASLNGAVGVRYYF